jgi:hypothetical protein
MCCSRPIPACGPTRQGASNSVTTVDDQISARRFWIECGKRGGGYCKSIPGALRPLEGVKARLVQPAWMAPPGRDSGRYCQCSRRTMVHARTHRPHLSEGATRALQDHLVMRSSKVQKPKGNKAHPKSQARHRLRNTKPACKSGQTCPIIDRCSQGSHAGVAEWQTQRT